MINPHTRMAAVFRVSLMPLSALSIFTMFSMNIWFYRMTFRIGKVYLKGTGESRIVVENH
jgi:hypothetical protein